MRRDRIRSGWGIAILAALAAFHASPANAGPNPVLRLRGGPAWEDNHNYTGPAWLAGASAGLEIDRWIIITLGVDRIDLDDFRVATPVALQVDVGKPFRDGVRPRVLAGIGPWYVQLLRTVDVDYFGDPPTGFETGTIALLGGYAGAGISFPLDKYTALDTALRYQLAHNENGTIHLFTTDAGLTFRF